MKIFIQSILAGMFIAIGTIVYLNVGGIVGALLFPFGLLMILQFKLKLYTGAIGYIESYKHIPKMLLILLGNAIGCCLMFFFPIPTAATLVASKLAVPLLLVFIKAIICGILIYCAVESYNLNKDYLTAAAVTCFILGGTEHSIADICIIISAGVISWEVLLFLLIVVLGNAVGSIIFHRLREKIK